MNFLKKKKKKKKKKTTETILQETDKTRLLINRICINQATFFSHVMRREKLEHLMTTGMIEGKCSREKQSKKMLNGLEQIG